MIGGMDRNAVGHKNETHETVEALPKHRIQMLQEDFKGPMCPIYFVTICGAWAGARVSRSGLLQSCFKVQNC